MSPRAHLFVAAVTVLLVVWVVLLVRRHRLKSKYSVLWLGLSLLLLVVAAVPDPLDRLSKAIGIDYPLSAAMRHRVKSYQTNIYAEVVAARVARKAAAQKETEAAEQELRQELLGAARGRLVFQVPRGR